jgi:hypothetical protein
MIRIITSGKHIRRRISLLVLFVFIREIRGSNVYRLHIHAGRAQLGWREMNHGFQMGTDDLSKMGLAEKSKIFASLLEEFLFLTCPIRDANAPVPLTFLCAPCVFCGYIKCLRIVI